MVSCSLLHARSPAGYYLNVEFPCTLFIDRQDATRGYKLMRKTKPFREGINNFCERGPWSLSKGKVRQCHSFRFVPPSLIGKLARDSSTVPQRSTRYAECDWFTQLPLLLLVPPLPARETLDHHELYHKETERQTRWRIVDQHHYCSLQGRWSTSLRA